MVKTIIIIVIIILLIIKIIEALYNFFLQETWTNYNEN